MAVACWRTHRRLETISMIFPTQATLDNDLSADVTNITSRLVLLVWGDEMARETRESFEQAKQIPWRYNSQQRAGIHRKSQKKTPKQPRPSK
jgi:hypothetical protein